MSKNASKNAASPAEAGTQQERQARPDPKPQVRAKNARKNAKNAPHQERTTPPLKGGAKWGTTPQEAGHPMNTTQKNPAPAPVGLSVPLGGSGDTPRTREALLSLVFGLPVAVLAVFAVLIPPSPAPCQSSPVSGASAEASR